MNSEQLRQGLQGCPASFARLIDYTMRGLQGLLIYIDDVLVHTFGHEISWFCWKTHF